MNPDNQDHEYWPYTQNRTLGNNQLDSIHPYVHPRNIENEEEEATFPDKDCNQVQYIPFCNDGTVSILFDKIWYRNNPFHSLAQLFRMVLSLDMACEQSHNQLRDPMETQSSSYSLQCTTLSLQTMQVLNQGNKKKRMIAGELK